MVSVEIIPSLFVLFLSIWSLTVFVFQKAFRQIHEFDKKIFYAGVFLVFITVTYILNIGRYFFSNIPMQILEYFEIVATMATIVFIFIYNNHAVQKILKRGRLYIYLGVFTLFVIFYLIFKLNISMIVHIIFAFFLVSEIVAILWYPIKNKKLKKEYTFIFITYLIILSLNIIDVISEGTHLIFGIGTLVLAFPFYFMIKYRDIKQTTRDRIITLSKIAKQERESFSSSIELIVNLLESKNQFLQGHSEKVSLLATLIGNRIGLSLSDLEDLQTTALLHDIGYIGVPIESFSNKKVLNFKDFEKIKLHPAIGAEILEKSKLFSKYADFVLYHHENWDGTGYPFGLKGENIPLFSRIIQIADSYAALITDRFYRSALSRDDSLLVMKTGREKEFDPKLLDAFIKCINPEI